MCVQPQHPCIVEKHIRDPYDQQHHLELQTINTKQKEYVHGTRYYLMHDFVY